MKMLFLVFSAVFLLSACGDRPQGMGGVKSDVAPYQGTGVAAFTAPGWKAGDRTSWESALRARAQFGQNDYSRIN